MVRVLDLGEVELLDIMGSDDAIVEAARVSYQQGGKKQSNLSLLRYLYRHAHTSPFEMCELKFRIKAPIFVARQWLRHRTASVNEVSYRYVQAPEQYYIPDARILGTQDDINKQGTNYTTQMGSEWEEELQETIEFASRRSFSEYTGLLQNELSREQARMILPLNTYTEWIWKIDLHNLLHFLELRMDQHAQYEIKEYAQTMYAILKHHFPQTMQAFNDYTINAMTLNALDIEVLKKLHSGEDMLSAYQAADQRWTSGDIRESKEKLARLGLV